MAVMSVGSRNELSLLVYVSINVMAVMSVGSRNELSLLVYVSVNAIAVIVSWQ